MLFIGYGLRAWKDIVLSVSKVIENTFNRRGQVFHSYSDEAVLQYQYALFLVERNLL